MAIQLVNTGALPNDGEGDPLRVAFQKINNNFVYLQQTASTIVETVTLDNTPNQIIFTYPANEFTQGMFQIKTYNSDNNDSQDIMLQAQTLNDYSNVKFTGYGTSFSGNSLSTYDMEVVSGNVNITVTPLANVVLNHFIAYQITWVGDLGVGLTLISEADGNLVTETANVYITTEG
jgi:hypothetical protein